MWVCDVFSICVDSSSLISSRDLRPSTVILKDGPTGSTREPSRVSGRSLMVRSYLKMWNRSLTNNCFTELKTPFEVLLSVN